MNRFLALVGAVILAFISVSSACTAAPAQWIHFTLEPERGRDGIQANFRSEGRAGHQNNWSADFRPGEFAGLDIAGFRGAGTRPLRFSLTREAGRLDCSGLGGQSHAEGNCGFTPDASFLALLDSRGIARPTDEQAFGLMAVNARRELIDAISAARYPAPKISDLIALAALDVSGAYIREMAGAGYRPPNLQGLVQFKAMGITPQWIAGFVRIGYGDLPADQEFAGSKIDLGGFTYQAIFSTA